MKRCIRCGQDFTPTASDDRVQVPFQFYYCDSCIVPVLAERKASGVCLDAIVEVKA